MVKEERKFNGQTTQWFLKFLFWMGHSLASLMPLAKANHISKSEVNRLLQEVATHSRIILCSTGEVKRASIYLLKTQTSHANWILENTWKS